MRAFNQTSAKINLLLIGEKPLLKPLVDLPPMAEKAGDMLHQALDAFIKQDVELARVIPAQDDVVDHLYDQINRELLTFVMADPANIDRANPSEHHHMVNIITG